MGIPPKIHGGKNTPKKPWKFRCRPWQETILKGIFPFQPCFTGSPKTNKSHIFFSLAAWFFPTIFGRTSSEFYLKKFKTWKLPNIPVVFFFALAKCRWNLSGISSACPIFGITFVKLPRNQAWCWSRIHDTCPLNACPGIIRHLNEP